MEGKRNCHHRKVHPTNGSVLPSARIKLYVVRKHILRILCSINRMRPLITSCLLLVSFQYGACGYHHVEPVRPDAYSRVATLSFLKDGETTRTDIVSRLGQPSGTFEQGRIITYWLDTEYRVAGRGEETTRYSLVLVFESPNEVLLKRHSLDRVK
jgi:hypothetical protein